MINKDQICKNIDECLDARVVTFLNPYSILKLSESKTSLKHFDKLCIDGIALKIFLGFVYKNTDIERISFDFTSVANHVFENAAANKECGFVLGSDVKSNSKFINIIHSSFSGIQLEGRSGYFNDDADLADLLGSLANSNYEFIVIGMGAVKQEEVANTLVENGFKGKIYTCGGFIHQTAMNGGEYYPAWIDKLNLRFVYRMVKEPTTILRYLVDYPKSFYMLTRNMQSFKC